MDDYTTAWIHGYSDAKYGFTYISDNVGAYSAGWEAYMNEQKTEDISNEDAE